MVWFVYIPWGRIPISRDVINLVWRNVHYFHGEIARSLTIMRH